MVRKTEKAWLEEEVAFMLEVYRTTSKSFGAIADMVNAKFGNGRSRNAIIGKVNRLDKRDLRAVTSRGVQIKKKKKTEPPRSFKKVGGVSVPLLGTINSRLFECEPIEEIPREGIGIMELNHVTCRWPLGPVLSRPPYEYCGRRIIEGKPWCREHAARSHQPLPQRTRRPSTAQ